MSTRFTPGPWKRDGYSVWGKTAGEIATKLFTAHWRHYKDPFNPNGYVCDGAEALGNAALASRAPDMYNAIYLAIDALNNPAPNFQKDTAKFLSDLLRTIDKEFE